MIRQKTVKKWNWETSKNKMDSIFKITAVDRFSFRETFYIIEVNSGSKLVNTEILREFSGWQRTQVIKTTIIRIAIPAGE